MELHAVKAIICSRHGNMLMVVSPTIHRLLF